ncbi:protein of unknown function [Candidatus Methylomirabilis oxygeniifera]|uniref:DUF2442 domain-containing protein n=1 Tax=Methylomirabilis oxygeniifera TaxID=671143 RepID=D5MN48_METO1|nr:protein of unknown function [Candidatus Methylomirabilis oxyfera]
MVAYREKATVGMYAILADGEGIHWPDVDED